MTLSSKRVRTLAFDESGNLGSDGRYFVIACVDTYNEKSLHNAMKKKIGQAKDKFPKMLCDSNEIKAVNAYPAVKHHILECIVSKDVTISYIVADLNYVYPELLEDKNCFYNYLMKLLLDDIISKKDKYGKIEMKLDNKTVKVKSINSFSDYIKIHFNYQKLLNLDLSIEYIDSNAKNGYVIQAADYVANTVYSYYEYNHKSYYNIISHKINAVEEFPRSKFGQLEVI